MDLMMKIDLPSEGTSIVSVWRAEAHTNEVELSMPGAVGCINLRKWEPLVWDVF